VSLDLSRALVPLASGPYHRGPPKVTDQALSVELKHVLGVLKANAGSLRRVRISFLWLRYPEEVGWTPEWSHATLNLEDTVALARAAPHAALESELCATVTDESFSTERGEGGEPSQRVESSVGTLCALFRREAPLFAHVALRAVNLSGFHFAHRGAVPRPRAFAAFCAALAQHASLTSIRCHGGFMADVMADAAGVALGAFVDAAVALPALRSVELCYMHMPPAPLPALARLLRGAAGGAGLQRFSFRVFGMSAVGNDFLTGDEGVSELCAAITAATALTTLEFMFGGSVSSTVQFQDAVAGAAIMAAARGHPTLRAITINNATLPT
jgi:hypothetical protein